MIVFGEAFCNLVGRDKVQEVRPRAERYGVLTHSRSFLFNSWRNQPWYEMDMGTGKRPVRAGMPNGDEWEVARYCHLEDCSYEGDVRVMLRVPPDELVAFTSFLTAENIPFTSFEVV